MRADKGSGGRSRTVGSGTTNAGELKQDLVVFNRIRVVSGISHFARRDHHSLMIPHDSIAGPIEEESSIEYGRGLRNWRDDGWKRLAIHADEHVIRRQRRWRRNFVTRYDRDEENRDNALTKQVHSTSVVRV